MFKIAECGLLIVAYARANNVRDIIETAISTGVKRIYVVLDVSDDNLDIQNQQSLIESFIFEIQKSSNVSVKLVKRSSNVGCSANILSGIDWAFSFENYLAIIEDDCLPTTDFYSLLVNSRNMLETDPNIWIVGGMQVSPDTAAGQVLLSRYPITWGWATTREKWSQIRNAIIQGEENFSKFNKNDLTLTERLYWRTGARRSYSGIIDAWDIVLALAFLQKNKFCILPPESLIRNVGDDHHALHTNTRSSGIQMETGLWNGSLDGISRSLEYEAWIRSSHYKIRKRHLITNQIRRILDLLMTLRRVNRKKNLLDGWRQASIYS